MIKRLFLSIMLMSNLAYGYRDNAFEQVGDVLTLMPAFIGVISLGMEDYKGLGQLALGTILTQTSIEIIKRSLEYAHNKGYDVNFAKRPCCADWKGMPSGHSGGGFSAAAFVYYRYGWKPAIPTTILAILTAASRVYAKKHTLWQVAAGGAIAWSFGWLVTTKYQPKNFSITPNISLDSFGGMELMAQVYYRF